MDQSAGHPEGAGGEHPRHGDHCQPQAARGRGQRLPAGDRRGGSYEVFRAGVRCQCAQIQVPPSQEDQRPPARHVQPLQPPARRAHHVTKGILISFTPGENVVYTLFSGCFPRPLWSSSEILTSRRSHLFCQGTYI